MSNPKSEKKSKIVGYSSMDDGGPGGKGFAITEDDLKRAREIYDELSRIVKMAKNNRPEES
ncbi:hypothetical protein Alches_23550 [Alicyclobacillus hesperidum subsp. aegles]|nr:hypothetical protein Alches_23550 [Alicyclobacillus hesperidum subsp. aegles]